MNPGSNQEAILTGSIFTKAFMFMQPTIASPYATSGQTPFGELQKITLDFDQTDEKAVGPESLYPIGVGATGRKLTFSAESMTLRANAFRLFAGGGAPAYQNGSDQTQIDSDDSNDRGNIPFTLHLLSPIGGDDIEVIIWKAYSSKLALALALRKYVMPNVSGEACYATEQTVQSTWRILLPGDQTVDSTPSAPVAPVVVRTVPTIATLHPTVLAITSQDNTNDFFIERCTTIGGTYLVVGSVHQPSAANIGVDVYDFMYNEPAGGVDYFYRVRGLGPLGFGPYCAIITSHPA